MPRSNDINNIIDNPEFTEDNAKQLMLMAMRYWKLLDEISRSGALVDDDVERAKIVTRVRTIAGVLHEQITPKLNQYPQIIDQFITIHDNLDLKRAQSKEMSQSEFFISKQIYVGKEARFSDMRERLQLRGVKEKNVDLLQQGNADLLQQIDSLLEEYKDSKKWRNDSKVIDLKKNVKEAGNFEDKIKVMETALKAELGSKEKEINKKIKKIGSRTDTYVYPYLLAKLLQTQYENNPNLEKQPEAARIKKFATDIVDTRNMAIENKQQKQVAAETKKSSKKKSSFNFFALFKRKPKNTLFLEDQNQVKDFHKLQVDASNGLFSARDTIKQEAPKMAALQVKLENMIEHCTPGDKNALVTLLSEVKNELTSTEYMRTIMFEGGYLEDAKDKAKQLAEEASKPKDGEAPKHSH